MTSSLDVLRMTNDIFWNMENKLVTAVTLLALSATFDTVDHDILLEVLHNNIGIDGNTIKWYSNYLRPRKFKVNINKAYSTEMTMQFSVPQVSVQGAFLFIAYTLTFPGVIKDLTLSSFADGHSLRKAFSSHWTNDEQNTIATIEKTMFKVKSWMDAVCLKLNESKTEFIYFGSQQLLQKCNAENIKVINETTTRNNKIKYLGGTLDSSLQFKTHITNKCRAAMVDLIWIKHIRKYIDKNMSHISQITSIISAGLLQIHTSRPAQKVNKCNAMHTNNWSKIDPE